MRKIITSMLLSAALMLSMGSVLGPDFFDELDNDPDNNSGDIGAGGECSADTECQEGLACHNGYCTGTGTAQPGDPCNGTVDCTPGSICWNSICLGVGALRFSLAWNADTDFDLHVTTPTETHIYYGARSGDGGELDVDDCVSGNCAEPGATHVENVVFANSASSGVYTFWAHNYSGSMTDTFTLEVYSADDLLVSQSGTLSTEVLESEHFTITR